MRYAKLIAKLAIVAFLAASGLQLAACNTVEGAGEDISAAGRGLSNSAEDVKKEM